jgi:hypothetical protein
MATTVTVTSGYPKTENIGSKMVYIWRITDVDDGELLATGLSRRFQEHWVSWTGNPSTQASAGGHTAVTDDEIQFFPSSDNLGATVFVTADTN